MASAFPRCPISELGWGQLGRFPLAGDKAEDLLSLPVLQLRGSSTAAPGAGMVWDRDSVG